MDKVPLEPAPDLRGNTLKGFVSFNVKAKARIWPALPHMCHVRSTAACLLKLLEGVMD